DGRHRRLVTGEEELGGRAGRPVDADHGLARAGVRTDEDQFVARTGATGPPGGRADFTVADHVDVDLGALRADVTDRVGPDRGPFGLRQIPVTVVPRAVQDGGLVVDADVAEMAIALPGQDELDPLVEAM